MTVCSRIKGYTRHHERVADLFSLLAVLLLFGSIWVAIEYQALAFDWIRQNIVLHGPAVIAVIIIDVFLIFMFLNIGASRFSEDEHSGCFHTFRGRRHGAGSLGKAFSNWIDHIEHVNKKHR